MRWLIWALAPTLAWAQPAEPGEQEPVPVDPETEAPLPVEDMLAEPPSTESGGEGVVTTFDRRVVAWVTAEYVELRKGPGPAYVSEGRAYQRDQVLVKARSADGRWYQLEAGGLRGWVRTNTVELVREDVKRGRDGKADAGRDRRETNYGYDAKGRRIAADGRPVGSGEGTAGDDAFDEADAANAEAPPPRLHLSLGIGAAEIGRDFASNIVVDGQGASALSKLKVSSVAVSTALGVSWAPLDVLVVAGRFRDSRFTDTTIPANAQFGFQQPVTLTMDAQQLDLDVVGQYPVAGFTFGGYAGLRLLRQAFQQTKPYALFLTNTYTSLGAGVRIGATLGPVDVVAQGGIDLPLSVSQDPVGSGDPTAQGFDAALTVAYAFTPAWAVYVDGHFQRIETDFEGPSEHTDTVTAAAPRAYSLAKEKDHVIGGGVGVRWSL